MRTLVVEYKAAAVRHEVLGRLGQQCGVDGAQRVLQSRRDMMHVSTWVSVRT